MKGIIIIYINTHPDMPVGMDEAVKTMREVNSQALERLEDQGEYGIMLIPTTKEACRIEKLELAEPFPRFLPAVKSRTDQLRRRDKRQSETPLVSPGGITHEACGKPEAH